MIKIVFNVVNNLQYSPYKDKTIQNLSRCDQIVCNSRYNADYLSSNFSLNNVSYLPNYYLDRNSNQEPLPRSSPELRIVSCGSLDRQKSYQDLLKAASFLVDKEYSFSLTIFGDGIEKTSLERLALKKGIKKFQIIVGEDFRRHVSNYDVFVCCSLFEGYPNALLEAQISGLPSVSYNIAYGPNEIIKDGYSGILISKRDPQALALAIDNVALDLNSYKINTKVYAKKLRLKHSVNNSIEKLVDLIKLA